MSNRVLHSIYRRLNSNSNGQFFYLVWLQPLIFFTQHNYFRDYGVFNGNVYVSDIVRQGRDCIILSSGANWYWNDSKYRLDQHRLTLKGLNQFRLDYPNVRIILLHPDESFVEGYPPNFEYINFNRNALIDTQSYNVIENYNDYVYDAIYNANFYRYKRHNLIKDVDKFKIGLIYYHRTQAHNSVYYIGKDEIEYGLETESFFRNKKNFHLLNNSEGKYVFLSKKEVNNYYNQSRCGLCLSDVEGACLVSVEYLLAGLPVISVRNVGGRDKFLKQMGEYAVTGVKDSIGEIEYYIDEFKNKVVNRQSVRERILRIIDREWLSLYEQMSKIGVYIGNRVLFRDSFVDTWKLYKL